MNTFVRAGAGLKPEHGRQILDDHAGIGWFEVHAENYMGAGGPPHFLLERVRSHHPLSIHGVGLSIGSAGGMTAGHLTRLKTVVDRYQPFVVSEHLAWSTHEGACLNDLLPLPYDDATLALVTDHIDEAQSFLGRRILIENPATYLRFDDDPLAETDFLKALACTTGCGLLLDVNNVHVSATNHGFDATVYLDSFAMEHVGEIHLAGYVSAGDGAEKLLIDTHDCPVSAVVWELYGHLIERVGAIPTLVEWDGNVPAWPVLAAEVAKADRVLEIAGAIHARAA